MRLFPAMLLLLGMACGGARAESLPTIPSSTRILTVQDVKNFWTNTLRRKAVPRKPSSLQPGALNAWQRKVRQRGSLILAVRNGDHDTRARLVQLSHNIRAWRELDHEEKAAEVEAELRELEEHLARLRTLELQREAAQAQIEAAKRLKEIESELSSLRNSCSHSCCPH